MKREICVMSILITAATAAEIRPFMESHPEADCLITGVGAAVTSYHLMKQLRSKSYSLILQCGLAGTFRDDITLGSAVVVERDRFADVAVWEQKNITSVFDLGLADPDEKPYNNGWLINKHTQLFPDNIRTVTSQTVNLLSDDIVYNNQLMLKHRAETESMEGAALHYVCLHEGIPFLQIRGISNKVGERNKVNWNINGAIDASNLLLGQLYSSIKI